MGHDHHFLSRLDRIKSEHLDLALELYRDPELVKQLLRCRAMSDRDRVALALDHGSFGPFVVVQGDGRFVTCLARGMSPGSLEILKRTELDRARNEVRVQRERSRVLHELRPEGDERSLWRRVTAGGEFVSREEIMALLALRPIYAEGLCDLAREACVCAAKHLMRALKLRSLTPRNRAYVHELYRLHWGIGHLAVLLGSDSGELAALPEWNKRLESIALSSFLTGCRPIALCGLYAITSDQDIGLEFCRAAWSKHGSTDSWLLALHGFTLLGLRYPKLEPEVRGILRTEPKLAAPEHSVYARLCRHAALGLFDDPGATARHFDNKARLLTFTMSQSLPADSPARFASEEEVPLDIARAIDLRTPAPALLELEATCAVLDRLPWIATLTPEEFYLPSAILKAFYSPWGPETGKKFLAVLEESYKRRAPPKPVQHAPGPNEPCSCGSGKKWKKCCGSPTAIGDD